jgi:hypothetical protein
MTFAIDPDIEAIVPAPTDEEVAQLEQGLLADGGCLSPLIVWKEGEVLLDGHTRYRLAQRHKLPYPTRTLSFESKEEAMTWVILHQLGRRNLTAAQQSYLRGKLQQEYVRQDRQAPTAEVAEQFKVSHATVKRDVVLSKAVDVIGSHSKAAKDKILRGDAKLSKRVAAAVAASPEQTGKDVAQQVARSRQTKQHLAKEPPNSLRANQVKDALAKLGMLVRACHTLGVYEKVRSHLSVIESEINR